MPLTNPSNFDISDFVIAAVVRVGRTGAVTEGPESEGPLTPAVFHILLALAANEMHGYAIMREVAILSEGRMSIGPGTLYGSIKKMVAAGLIEESARRSDPGLDVERRGYYRITELGSRVMMAEAERR